MTPLPKICEEITGLMKRNGTSRATITREFFLQIIDRTRIEDSFWENLNKIGKDGYHVVFVEIKRSTILAVRTWDRYLPEDPFVDNEDRGAKD